MKLNKTKNFFIAFVIMCAVNALLRADDSIGSLRLEYWNFGVDGNATVHGSSADLDDTSKVINGSNHGVVLAGERRFDNWGLLMDLFIGKQSTSKQLSSSQSVDWDFETAILSAAGFLSFLNHEFEGSDRILNLDGIAGIRGYSNNYKLTFNPYDPVNDKSRSDYVNWVDPYVGLRLKSAFSENWAVELYGDAGGFAIGNASELSVLTRAAIVWSINPGLNLIGGYRLFDLKSGDQSGDRQTELDVQMRGLTIGIEGKF